MGKNFIYWLRWILVLPGAMVAGFLATFPLHWFVLLLFHNFGGEAGEVDLLSLKFFALLIGKNAYLTEYNLYPAVIALFFIYGGSLIAPKYKFKTGLALFIIYVLVWLFVSYTAVFKGNIGGVNMWFSSRTIFALLGAILGLYMAKRKQTKIQKK